MITFLWTCTGKNLGISATTGAQLTRVSFAAHVDEVQDYAATVVFGPDSGRLFEVGKEYELCFRDPQVASANVPPAAIE
jgi:hypothetical protein